MACDDIRPAKLWFCYLKAPPFVFTVQSRPGLSVRCKTGHLNGRGSKVPLADVSSCPKFECCPQTVDCALFCCRCLVSRPPTISAKINRALNFQPLNDHFIFKACVSLELMLTNLALNDCCLDNSSLSGRVTTQTVVLAKHVAASSQQRSTELTAGSPFLIFAFLPASS